MLPTSSNVESPRRGFTFQNLQGIVLIKDYNMYYNLQDDLVQHMWDGKCSNYYKKPYF